MNHAPTRNAGDETNVSEKAVLFVDDEASILASLKRLLRKEPYTVHTAESGAKGLELLESTAVQLVVSDQRMPEMNGTQFLHEVKQRYPDTLRIVLSGYAEAAAIVDAINEGEVYRFIGKPWNEDDLRSTIRQALEHYDVVLENRALQEQSAHQLKELQRLNRMLEGSVEVRTRSLQMSQEMLECLPMMVVGVSQEQELMLVNRAARERIDTLAGVLPGTDIEDFLPPEAVEAIRSCLFESAIEDFDFDWDGRRLGARPAPLGGEHSPRGCVLLLKEETE